MKVPHLLVDFSAVTFMDSTGLSTLVTALKLVRPRGGTNSVVGASDRIMRLLHLFELDTMVTVLPEGRCLLKDAVPSAGITQRHGRIEPRRTRRERCGTYIHGHLRLRPHG
jgi:hypothetical protein